MKRTLATYNQNTVKHTFFAKLRKPDFALQTSASAWFFVYLLGQQFFAIYIAMRWGLPLITGDYESVNKSAVINGYIAGDTPGNGMLFIHVISAAILSFCGMLQLVPALRQKYPLVHRLNGRLFLILGLMGALTGLYLTWMRGSRLSDIGSIGVTLNGVLILVFSFYAWFFAIKGKIQLHKRLAIHSFLLVNGVWTFRLYLISWMIITQGGYGNSANLDGPADMVLSFACYLLPMAFAELYFWATRQKQHSKKWIAFGILSLGCVMSLSAIIFTALLMWLPAIRLALA